MNIVQKRVGNIVYSNLNLTDDEKADRKAKAEARLAEQKAAIEAAAAKRKQEYLDRLSKLRKTA